MWPLKLGLILSLGRPMADKCNETLLVHLNKESKEFEVRIGKGQLHFPDWE